MSLMRMSALGAVLRTLQSQERRQPDESELRAMASRGVQKGFILRAYLFFTARHRASADLRVVLCW